jgi:NAD(P)-dependent dehydrogenase (short-subunit alcohol dehydrogenase family)
MISADRIAVVTGAGTGIGRATSHSLLEAGWTVICAGRRVEYLDETIRTSPKSAKGHTAVVDISIPVSIGKLFSSVLSNFGRIDLLFNNAGQHGEWNSIEDVALSDWNSVIDVNLTGSFLCAQAAFRMMKAQSPMGGRIINNGSISAQVPRPRSVAYSTSKHAITGLTKCLSLEGRRYRIACSQIDIGNVATNMTTPISDGVLQADGSVSEEPMIDVAIAGEFISRIAELPLEANVQFCTLLATTMPFIGRG